MKGTWVNYYIWKYHLNIPNNNTINKLKTLRWHFYYLINSHIGYIFKETIEIYNDEAWQILMGYSSTLSITQIFAEGELSKYKM